ncbi:MAG: hypothetical protein KDI63_11385 [Gammaproteobacteria bacterium]|nr:hypothetical protein [Gammaproteobacteria bacterium]
MVRVNQLLLTVLLGALAAGLILALGTGGQSQISWILPEQPPQQSAGTTDTAGDLSAATTLRSRNEFSETVARPLFTQSRRPTSSQAEEVLGPQLGLRGPVERNQFLVMGIVITGNEKIALMRQIKGNDEVIRVKEGQSIVGWRVESIDAEAVTLSKLDATDVVKLSDNILSAAEKRTLIQQARQARIKEQVAAKAANTRQNQRQRARPRTPPPVRPQLRRSGASPASPVPIKTPVR